MFELEFAKLVDCKNEIDEETISKPTAKTIQKKSGDKNTCSRATIATRIVPKYLCKFQVADTQKGNAVGQQLDSINVLS